MTPWIQTLAPNPDAVDIGAIHRERQLEMFRRIRPMPRMTWWERIFG